MKVTDMQPITIDVNPALMTLFAQLIMHEQKYISEKYDFFYPKAEENIKETLQQLSDKSLEKCQEIWDKDPSYNPNENKG
jgi:hypothetical protein